MLVNLMPPVDVEPILREPEIVVSPTSQEGRFVVHPRYRQWLYRCGITSAKDAIDLPGEIVSGHPSRHVMQVTLKAGASVRTVFLKKEHAVGWRVRWRNWRDGFGWVSRAEREAMTLQRLEEHGLPTPHCIAYGEDTQGRAFLLIDELVGHRELRDVAADANLSWEERRTLIGQFANTLADIHHAGFTTPDLASKHVFIRAGLPMILDWQCSVPMMPNETVPRVEALAHLNATLADWLVTPRERLRFLQRYLKRMQEKSPEVKLELKPLATMIRTIAQNLRGKSSIREQCQPRSTQQRLVWLADEQVCAIPVIAKQWPTPAVCEPYYTNEVIDGERLSIRLGDDRPATLLRFRTADPLGRGFAFLRGKSWRSRASKLARMLFALEKAGVDVPQLYAFGQRLTSLTQADSFLVHNLPTATVTLGQWLGNLTQLKPRRRLLAQLGANLRSMHDTGCTVQTPDSFRIVHDQKRTRLVVDPTLTGQLVGIMDESSRVQNIIIVLRDLTTMLTKADCLRILKGYEPAKTAPIRKSFSLILQQVTAAR